MMTRATTEHPTGYALLHNPRLNKGTAFTEAERRAYGLEGLLPPAITNTELQVGRQSVSLPQSFSEVENPAFRAGLGRWLGDRVGRDARVFRYRST